MGFIEPPSHKDKDEQKSFQVIITDTRGRSKTESLNKTSSFQTNLLKPSK